MKSSREKSATNDALNSSRKMLSEESWPPPGPGPSSGRAPPAFAAPKKWLPRTAFGLRLAAWELGPAGVPCCTAQQLQQGLFGLANSCGGPSGRGTAGAGVSRRWCRSERWPRPAPPPVGSGGQHATERPQLDHGQRIRRDQHPRARGRRSGAGVGKHLGQDTPLEKWKMCVGTAFKL